ncbi:glycosyltransferase [Nesterenkonia flava]|uniref:Glycosyltransferase n=1 Tax=Nesterenkonia flava TaxID=469799 RepID=A0ABU1FRH2_9MICC|nr:glycosyltransferase [Nesterenkonia flava]MDR5710771.1 glycosyltransferase [Nesterenkonia flava]
MKPLVSIIIPAHNSEATIVRTLNSVVEQTLRHIEIIVVDDSSTDATNSLCREAQTLDDRIRLITLNENHSVFQARRIGAEEARGTYIMFCDADDELEPRAAEEASAFAQGGSYDVVHFSVSIVGTTGSKYDSWERALSPFEPELFGPEILLRSSFGQPGAKIEGNIWNKLYERKLIRRAWSKIDPELRLTRAEDLFQTFLILSSAQRYGGLYSRLYRYNFGAGKSGNIANSESFQHFLSSVHTYRVFKEHTDPAAWLAPEDFDTDEMLDRLRAQLIENQLNYWLRLPQPADQTFRNLVSEWGSVPILKVLAQKFNGKEQPALEAFRRLTTPRTHASSWGETAVDKKSVAILGNIAGAGGVQRIISAQAELLDRAGYSVTVLSFDHDPNEVMYAFPSSVTHRQIGSGSNIGAAVSGLVEALREHRPSVVLNHDNYSVLFPWIPIITRTGCASSVLFVHNFALRSMLDFRDTFAHFPQVAGNYDLTVTLSEADTMWWEASGVHRVRTLPNFTDFALVADVAAEAHVQDGSVSVRSPATDVDLLWLGRLHDSTKNASGALEVFAQIVALRPGTTLAIVGGEQNPGELARLERLAEGLGIRDQVIFAGPSNDVGAWYRASKVFLITATIEGFNLTLVEAQASGLPVVMYDLPYLETVSGNPGIVSVNWGAVSDLAEVTVGLLNDAEEANKLGTAGQDFVRKFSKESYSAQLLAIVDEVQTDRRTRTGYGPADPSRSSTMTIPVSVMEELYRLYGQMHRRVSGELRTAKRENATLRKGLSQLKRVLSESRAQHQELETLIAQVEKGRSAATRRKPQQSHVKDYGQKDGRWPLWARQGAQPFAPSLTPIFEDLPVTHEAAVPAAWALDAGIIETSDRPLFEGDRTVSRHEFIRMLYRTAGTPSVRTEQPIYRDLDPNDPAIAWAVERKIMTAPTRVQEEGPLPEWKPGTPLRRRTAAMLLYRAAGRPKYRPPHVSPYDDLSAGQKFYTEMCWAAHQGVLPAVRQKNDALVFKEGLLMTRAEIIMALFRQMVGPLVMTNGR